MCEVDWVDGTPPVWRRCVSPGLLCAIAAMQRWVIAKSIKLIEVVCAHDRQDNNSEVVRQDSDHVS